MKTWVLPYTIGMSLIILDSILSTGYLIYLWGKIGLSIGLATWLAFKIFIVFFCIGLIIVLFSFFKLYKDTK